MNGDRSSYRLVLTFLLAFPVLAAVALPAQAQGFRAEGTIDVLARVIESLGVQGTNDLDFGEIVMSDGTHVSRIAKDDPSAGMFTVTGGAAQDIQIDFEAPTSLIRQEGTGEVAIDLEIYAAPVQSGAVTAQRLLRNETIRLDTGRHYFFIAGSLTVGSASDNPPGTYSGEFELSVSYTSI